MLITGVMGCMGVTGLAAWGWQRSMRAAQLQQGSSPGNFMPPQGPMGGAAESAEEDGDEEEEAEEAAAQAAHPSEEGPGCFLSELVFEADRDQNGHYGAWAFVSFASREPIACPSTRRKPLNSEARALRKTWPVEEELLQVEISPPQPDPNNPGFFRKLVRAQTRVAEEAP